MTSRRFARAVLLIAFIPATGAGGPALAQEAAAANILQPIELEMREVEKTHNVNPADGSTVIGGHVGVTLECTPCPQAYAKMVDSGSEVAWHYTANADRDCDGNGVPDGEGEPLFGNWTIFDPSFIFGSTVSASAFHPSGDVFLAGQLLVAYAAEGTVQGAWGAFVLRFSPEGTLVGQAYFGAVPGGEPPNVATCEALCSALNDSGLEQNAGGAIAYRQGAVAIGGWTRPPTPEGVGDKDVFVALLDEDLTSTSWTFEHRVPGSDDEVLAVAFDGAGEVYVSGYFGAGRDGFAARFDALAGSPTQYLTFAGPLDDEGTGIEAEGPAFAEVLRLDGFFTDAMLIGGEVFTGTGVTFFSACLSRGMNVLQVDIPPAAVGSCAGGQALRASAPKVQQIDNPASGLVSETEAENNPVDVEIVAGQGINCRHLANLEGANCVDRVEHSDNKYLNVYGELPEEPEDGDLIEIDFTFDLPGGKPKLTWISFEMVSEYCMEIDLALGGGDAPAGVLYELDEIDVCPLDEPVVTIEVPESIAQALGFWSSLPQQSLVCKMRARLFGIECSTCDSAGKNSELDDLTAGSEVPEL